VYIQSGNFYEHRWIVPGLTVNAPQPHCECPHCNVMDRFVKRVLDAFGIRSTQSLTEDSEDVVIERRDYLAHLAPEWAFVERNF
jgi:hypothetical protein